MHLPMLACSTFTHPPIHSPTHPLAHPPTHPLAMAPLYLQLCRQNGLGRWPYRARCSLRKLRDKMKVRCGVWLRCC